MPLQKKTSRRRIIKAGLASAASLAVLAPNSHAAKTASELKPKAKGETKIVFLGGDYLHNGETQELALRGVFYSQESTKNYRFIKAQDCTHVTPELIKDADLLLICRWGGDIPVFCTEPLCENRPMAWDGYMPESLEKSSVDNVKNRGMGLGILHCAVWIPEREEFTKLMGIKAIMHGPIQAVKFHDFNQVHPITKGIKEFSIGRDENFGVEIADKNAVPLFQSTGTTDNRNDIAGWCIEQGKGRVIGLLAGHTWDAWTHKTYKELQFRAFMWAMHKEIPPFTPPSNALGWMV